MTMSRCGRGRKLQPKIEMIIWKFDLEIFFKKKPMTPYTAPTAPFVFKDILNLFETRDESTNEKIDIFVTIKYYVVNVLSGSRAQAKACIRKT